MVMGLQDEEVRKEVVEWGEIGPCDICKIKRVRWFCAADDAYLCHACDTSVHSANSVACRHERVRLTHPRITSLGLMADVQSSWPTKKIRSKRLKKSCSQNHGDFGPDTDLNVQLFFDSEAEIFQFHGEGNCLEFLYQNDDTGFNDSQGSSPVDGMEETFSWEIFDRVKVEETDCEGIRVGVSEELFDLNIDLSEFTVNTQDEDVKVNQCNLEGEERKLCLMLNYEDVLSAWSDRGSPWAHNSTLQDEMVSEETVT